MAVAMASVSAEIALPLVVLGQIVATGDVLVWAAYILVVLA